MRIPFIAAGVALVAFAGCLSGPPESVPAADDPSAPFELAADSSGCIESIAFFLVDFDHLEGFLPDGFRPKDAQAALGTPAPTGKGAAFVTAIDCEQHELAGGPLTWAEGGILVEEPAVDPAIALDDGLDFYSPAYHPGADAATALLAEAGAVASTVTVDVRQEAGPLAVGGAATVTDAEGELFAYAYEAPARSTMVGVVRLWQTTPTGLAYFDLEIPERPVAQGAITSCSLRAGSVWADVVGVTACAPGDAVALLFLEQGWDGAFRVLPGARAT